MIQLLAAVIFTLFSFGLLAILAKGMKKPYDNMDLWLAMICLVASLCGLGRIAWIAFH